METLTTAAIAVGTLILKQVFEKTGDKLSEAVTNQIGTLMQLLKKKLLPKTEAIAQAEPSADFKQAVLELETAANTDDEISQVILGVEAAVKADPELLQKIQTTARVVQYEPTLIQNNTKLAEKIGLVVQGGIVNLQNLNMG